MFGYVTVNKQDLTIGGYERYRAYYCGLCRTLNGRYGRKGQFLLSYDLTFLTILLEGVYEDPLADEMHRCVPHPAKSHRMLFNTITEYTADMCVLLSYYHLQDDWEDDRRAAGLAGVKLLQKDLRRIESLYPRQARAVRECVHQLSVYEKENESSLDKTAGLTGHMLSEIFAFREDTWTDELMEVGFYLGKFIYLLDAYKDLAKDRKRGKYNVWAHYADRKDFEALVENTLTMMMAEAARYFERLPIVQDADILRNVLYSGVWQKFRENGEEELQERPSGKPRKDRKPRARGRKGNNA